MRQRPIDQRALIHTIKWVRKRLTSKDSSVIIDKVRINPGYVVDENGSQQSGYANYKVYGDERYSTKVDGQAPKFAVGDSIQMINGPIVGYPKLMKIINVGQFYDLDGEHIHHIELLMR